MDTIRSSTVTPTAEADGRSSASADLDRPEAERHGWWAGQGPRPYLFAGGAYLLLSVIIWLHVWTGHPTSVTTCGCGDSSASIWYTAWPAYAISHGQNPLFSTAIGYPTGVNLIFAAYGVVLAPVTWLFGPVAALNVGLTISPVLSALAMFALVRRWVSWAPAALVAGLFYGFSPFVLTNLSVAHADFGMVAIPPLLVIGLDELLIRQRRNPIVTGTVLGLLIVLQFFVGAEVLILTLIMVAIGVVIIVAYAAARTPTALREHAKPVAIGCSATAVTALVLLVFPAWFALAGPAHFSGTVHPNLQLSKYGVPLRDLLLPARASDVWQHIVGGYQGPVLSSLYFGAYFGFGVILVSLGGLIFWWRDRTLWFFGALALISALLATSSGLWLTTLPFLRNIEPFHFVLFTYLAVAVMLGIVVDHVRSAVGRAANGDPDKPVSESRPRSRTMLFRWTGALAGLLVAALALAPPAADIAKSLPITVEPVVLPSWFRTVAPQLRGHPVILALPAPFTVTKAGLTWQAASGQRYPFAIGWKQAALTWQALGGQRYSMIGAGGLGAGVKHRAGENHGQDVITEVTFAYASRPNIASNDIAAVHRSLLEWGVTKVVLPDQPELPTYDKVASVTGMAALVAAATGAQPVHTADAWVWRQVNRDNRTAFPTATQYARCTGGPPGHGVAAVNRVVRCVLAPQALGSSG